MNKTHKKAQKRAHKLKQRLQKTRKLTRSTTEAQKDRLHLLDYNLPQIEAYVQATGSTDQAYVIADCRDSIGKQFAQGLDVQTPGAIPTVIRGMTRACLLDIAAEQWPQTHREIQRLPITYIPIVAVGSGGALMAAIPLTRQQAGTA